VGNHRTTVYLVKRPRGIFRRGGRGLRVHIQISWMIPGKGILLCTLHMQMCPLMTLHRHTRTRAASRVAECDVFGVVLRHIYKWMARSPYVDMLRVHTFGDEED